MTIAHINVNRFGLVLSSMDLEDFDTVMNRINTERAELENNDDEVAVEDLDLAAIGLDYAALCAENN